MSPINLKMITAFLFSHITNTCALEITVHWIDDKFCLHQQLLSFIHLTGSHTGSQLASNVYQTLDEYDLKKRLFCITGDNAVNNMTMAKHLLNHLAIKNNIAWDPDTSYIPCFAHIINLVMQKFIRAVIVTPGDDDEGNTDTGNGDDFTLDIGDDDLAFGGIISKLRGIVNSIRGSSRRSELFEQACRSCKITLATIPQDVAVRWNSTFRML